MHHFEGTVVRCHWCEESSPTNKCHRCHGTSFVLARITLDCGHEVWLKPNTSGSFRPFETTFSFDGILVRPGLDGGLKCYACYARRSET